MHRPAIIAILMFGSVTAQGSKGNPEQERLRLAFFSDLDTDDPLRIAKAAMGLGDAAVETPNAGPDARNESTLDPGDAL